MNKRNWLILFLFLFSIPSAIGQGEKFKALFMYNFTKYLEWPAEKQNGDFIIAIYGNSPIINELNIIAQKRKVGTQKIVIKKVANPGELKACNILYVPANRSSKINEIKSQCNNSGVVLVTDKPGLAKSYAGINYVMVNGKQNFEINRGNLESQGIKVNSALLSLGISIK